MELIGSLLLVLAVGLLVALFIARPFLRGSQIEHKRTLDAVDREEHERSSLLAERDRVLTALQELDFDFALGKVPEDDYPAMRGDLLKTGSDVLRRLEVFDEASAGAQTASVGAQTASAGALSAEERIEAAVAMRRADAGSNGGAQTQVLPETAASVIGSGGSRRAADPVEELIAARKRARQESAAGFCPQCGKPFQKSDKFCAKCGKVL